jgi:hypothetical protein
MTKRTGVFAIAIAVGVMSLGAQASATTYHSHNTQNWDNGSLWEGALSNLLNSWEKTSKSNKKTGVNWDDHDTRRGGEHDWRDQYVHSMHDHDSHKKWKKKKKKKHWHSPEGPPSAVPIPGVLPALILALGAGGLLGRKRRRVTPGDTAAVR